VGPEVREDQPSKLLDRIARDRNAALLRRARRFARHVRTLASAIEAPSMVGAAQPVAIRHSEQKRCAPMRTAISEQTEAAERVAK
jgi:DNA-binding PucR family transcriptional regulator